MTQDSEKSYKQGGLAAILAILFCMAGVPLLYLYISIYRPRFINICGYKLMWLPAAVGLIFSIIAVVKISSTPKPHRSRTLRSCSVMAGFAALVMIVFSILRPAEVYGLANRATCERHLNNLGQAMIEYAYENNNCYPDSEKWCDILYDSRKVLSADFICSDAFTVEFVSFMYSYPRPKRGRSCYAMNKNCRFDSDPDTVLLFDSRNGWNCSGGPELLTLKNHNGEGCNVLFNDGSVRFIKAEEIKTLNWGLY